MICVNLFFLALIFASFSASLVSGQIYLEDGQEVRLFYVGRSLKISCNYTHAKDDFQTFQWFKNEAPLVTKPDGRVALTSSEEELDEGLRNLNAYMTIKETIEEDVGFYKCKLESGLYENVVQASSAYQKRLPKSTEVEETAVIHLECEAKGDQYLTPTIHWVKDSIPLKDAVNSSRLTMFSNEDGNQFTAGFNITNAMQSDRGEYMCFATFDIGLVMNTTTIVRVKDPLRVLWPSIGIVVQALVLGITIFVCETIRRKEGDDDDEDDFPTLAKRGRQQSSPQPSTSAVAT